jgi:hypothetical protein
MALGDAQIEQQLGHALGFHRSAPVSMQGQVITGDALLGTSLANQQLGQFG